MILVACVVQMTIQRPATDSKEDVGFSIMMCVVQMTFQRPANDNQ